MNSRRQSLDHRASWARRRQRPDAAARRRPRLFRRRRRPCPHRPTGIPAGFGTGPAVGPAIAAATFAEAEKLMQVTLRRRSATKAAASWRCRWPRCSSGAPARASWRSTRRRARHALESSPARQRAGPARDGSCAAARPAAPLPASDDDIAFAPVTQLSRWIETPAAHRPSGSRASISSASSGSTQDELRHHVTRDLALAQAREPTPRSPREVSRTAARHSVGRQGSARHRRHRHHLRRRAVPDRVPRPTPRWWTASTRPARCWSPSSASARWRSTTSGSAGRRTTRGCSRRARRAPAPVPGAATAARLRRLLDGQRDRRQHHRAGDALRRHRPASDLRPGAAHRRDDALLVARQARADDPQCRGRDLVLAAISGPDAGDVSSVPSHLDFDANAAVKGLRVGYFPALDGRAARRPTSIAPRWTC